MRIFFPVIAATLLVLTSASEDEQHILSRSKRQIQGRLIRSREKRMANINVENIRSTSIQVGFNYISGAKGYLVTAKEYNEERRKVTQTVSTSEERVDEHKRQATLTNLHPGRSYLVEVQALKSNGMLIGSKASGVVKTALRCFVCDGRASNNECKGPSTILECPRGFDSCLNELRYQNGITTVTKRCTQYRPEFATTFRGGLDAAKACQGTIARDSFCFCACKSDLCNAEELPCATRCFPELKSPRGGSVDCTDANRGGSRCTWTCRGGRELVGVDMSTCRKDGTWSIITPPRCVFKMTRKTPTPKPPIFQCPELSNPDNGRVSCTDANQRGSVCSISCNRGYKLTGGTSRRTCSNTGRWTPSAAKCTEITCPIIRKLSHRLVSCTNGNRLSSICKFSCADTYSLNGAESITCQLNGEWSKSMPNCQRQGCYARPRTTPNLVAKCEDITKPAEGAICRYSCKVGFTLRGEATQKCQDGKWIGVPPICRRKRCSLSLTQPSNGYVQCSNGQFVGSVCTFRCQNDFAVVGQTSVTCQASEEWSTRSPKCRRIECEPIGEYRDGSYSCNKANAIGSVCSFTCNTGYGIPRRSRKRITCQAPPPNVDPDAVYPGRWNYPIPRCEKARCTNRALTKGLTRRCTSNDHREVSSTCTFQCIPGYYLAGRARIPCMRNRLGYSNGRWLTDNPVCIRRQCSDRVVLNGLLNCSDARFAGSKCTVVCDRGYQATSDPDVECGIDGRWSARVAQCTRVVCLESSTFQFRSRNVIFNCGRPEQSVRGVRRYFTDHQCSLTCRQGYDLRGGNLSTCGTDGKWNVPSAVVCEDRNECDEENGGCGHNCENEDGGYRCQCRENYKLASDRRTCLLTVCHELKQDPRQHMDCSNGRLIGSRCSITCVVGHEPRGGSTLLTCRTDGTWNKAQARCQKVKCGLLRNPMHGSLSCTNENIFESICTSTCDEGYELIGEKQTECISSKEWTHAIPKCMKIRCAEENTNIRNGRVECSNTNFFQSQCSYFCNPGYEYKGRPGNSASRNVDLQISRCRSDATWSSTPPTCVRSSCSPSVDEMISERPNSAISCTNSNLFESTCAIVCRVGYQVNGPKRTSCSESQTWTHMLGRCEKIQCSEYSTLLNGQITCTDLNYYQSQCTFQCTEGYNLVGNEVTTCRSDRTWSDSRPHCQKIECPESFTMLENGNASCSDEFRFGSQCTYVCDPGYEMTGVESTNVADSVAVLTCMADSTWGGQLPSCRRKRCSNADGSLARAAQSGVVTCSEETFFRSVCSVACNEGYELVGPNMTRCTASADWSPTLGYCQKIRCPAFNDLDNGETLCSDENRYQSTCNFSCNLGYNLVGSDSSICQADQTFSNMLPSCEKKRCSAEHLSLDNGVAQCSDDNKFESVCRYTCDAGYEITGGSEVANCQDDEHWSQNKAVCEKKICPSDDINFSRADLNGLVTCSEGHVFNSICSVSCDVGYELFAGSYISTRCNENAQWSRAIGHCTKILCPEFATLVNGVTGCSDANRFLSICEFGCNHGYEMTGSPLSTCQADTTWSSPLPLCSRVRCPADYLSLEHGRVHCTDANRYESTCSYECDMGYEVADVDMTSATCQATEAWSSPKPTCSKIKCPFDEADFLRADDTGTVVCTDENVFGSTCSVACPDGYELTGGSAEITCLDSEKWSTVIGYCEKIRCNVIHKPDNGDVECTDSNRFQSICGFACDIGYFLEGQEQSICQSDGTYTHPAPTCEKISCPDDHLNIRLGSVNCSEANLFESVCQYQCDEGYEFFESSLIAQSTVTAECLSDEQWDVDVPICEKKTCPVKESAAFLEALNQGASGTLSCSEGNRFGSVCQLKCSVGYESDGNNVVECTSEGSWNASVGICTVIECPPQDAPVDGSLNCTDNFNFDTECEFSCDEGHQFIAENGRVSRDDEGNLILPPPAIRAQCTEEKSWTVQDTPQCEKIICPLQGWDRLDNGNVSCADGNRFMSTCLYQCDPGYMLAHPRSNVSAYSALATCTSNGFWDLEDPPTCVRIECTPTATTMQEVEEHGVITCTNGSSFESQCDLVCNRGYRLKIGRNSTICQSDREWSVVVEPCEKIECTPLEAPAYSTVSCSNDYMFKSHCKVVCDDGYEIIDPENEYDEDQGISCRSDGSWCGELPKCAKISCPNDHLEINDGAVQCTNANVFESVCSYTCNLGFHMVQGQSDSATCTSNGLWTSTLPTCENNRCPANESSIFEAQVHGEVTCTDENKFESKCLLHCFDGYEATGEFTTTCNYDGTWSNGLGLCKKLSCQPFQPPVNTTIMCTDEYRFQSSCVFKCLPGYVRTDAVSEDLTHDITCGADGRWTGTVRHCEKLSCPAEGYEVVENGQVRCTDGHLFSTECLFSCNPGYHLVDRLDKDVEDPSVRCTTDGTWSMDEAPHCIASECSPTAEEMDVSVENGELRCTRSSQFGSRCVLICNEGYTLDGEYSFTQCESNNKWWPALGSCKKIECAVMPLPPNVEEIQCNDGNNFGSACFVTRCRSGYKVRNPEQNLRTCNEQKHWSGLELECSEFIDCPSSHLELENGHVVCTEQNRFNSQCDYYCNPSYELTTNRARSQCQANGEWSSVKPSCVQRRTCTSTYFSLGIVNCNAGGSCQLICDPGSELVGTSISSCSDNNGNGPLVWNPPLGECRKRSCTPTPRKENLHMTCSDGHLYRSLCRFHCRAGYQLIGTETTSCESDGIWSNEPPRCEAIECPITHLTLENGAVSATNHNNAGSQLTYSCHEEGFELIGSSEITCLLRGVWSEPKPICRLGRCPPLHLPNGQVQCDRSVHNEYGAQCRYVCNDLYQLQGESENTTCGFNSRWSTPRPYCRGHCDVDFSEFQNGFVFCTDSNWHNSKCSFACGTVGSIEQPYHLYGNDEATCQENGRWSQPPPCCEKPCPPSGKLDMYFVLDSSDSVGYDNWTKVLSFVDEIISSFNVGSEDLLVGVVRYHRDVDARDEIKIGEYQTLSSLRNVIRFLNYGGYGTNTGKALRHVTQNTLKAAGNRPDARDYVILITDGSSEDDVSEAAVQLKNANTTVFTVGIAGSRLNREQLNLIATSPSDVLIAENGFTDLASSMVERITKQICKNPCLLNETYLQNARNYVQTYSP